MEDHYPRQPLGGASGHLERYRRMDSVFSTCHDELEVPSMTVATGFAIDVPGLRMVAVLADSRLSWADGRYAEIAVKAHDVGRRVAVVSAGLGLVGPYAAELARSMIEASAAAGNQPPFSLWDVTRVFAYFAREVQRDLRSSQLEVGADHVANEFVLAGFYADGTPGVSWLRLTASAEEVEFWRPGPEQFACFTVGASPAKEIVQAAYADFGPRSRFEDPTMAAASAMLYAMRAEGEPFRSVGGGITIGICTTVHKAFTWPAVEIDGERFFRGFRVPSEADQDPKSILRLEVDTNYAAALDRRVEDARHGKHVRARQSRTHECSVAELIGQSPIRRTPEPPSLQGMSLR